MTTENRRNNIDWLVEKLREAERERDEAVAHARNLEIDNFRLRVKLQSISNFVCDEEYIEDLYIPDDDYADLDIPDVEETCGMPSV